MTLRLTKSSNPSPVVTVDRFGYCPLHGIPVRVNSACDDCLADKPDVVPARRLNVGCGQWPLLYWTNLDASPSAIADIYASVPPIQFDDESLDEIYAGHVLEHMTPADARAFLAECLRCLVPGGRLGVVVPDTREVMRRWLRGDLDRVEYPPGVWRQIADLDEVCALFLYSTVQDSPHRWSYDQGTLCRLLESAGFEVIGEIDRYVDPRLGTGQWYQAGFDCIKPEVAPCVP